MLLGSVTLFSMRITRLHSTQKVPREQHEKVSKNRHDSTNSVLPNEESKTSFGKMPQHPGVLADESSSSPSPVRLSRSSSQRLE